jgi:hypothetical protein
MKAGGAASRRLTVRRLILIGNQGSLRNFIQAAEKRLYSKTKPLFL